MRARRVKQLLATMLVVGGLGSVTVGSVDAVLRSEEQNAQASIATGTLNLSNTVGAGTACTSYGAGSVANVNSTCDPVVTYVPAAENYPGVPVRVSIAIKNVGSLAASDLSVYMPTCSAAATPDAPAPGGANPCAAGGAQFYVQETDSLGAATKCWFPGGGVTCSFSADTLSSFATHSSAATAVDLGSGPAALQTRYFVIGLQLPITAANTLQGEAAAFLLAWQMTS